MLGYKVMNIFIVISNNRENCLKVCTSEKWQLKVVWIEKSKLSRRFGHLSSLYFNYSIVH